MLWTILGILLVLWLLGFFGPRISYLHPPNRQRRSHAHRHRDYPHYIESAGGDITRVRFDEEAGAIESRVAS